MEGNWAVKLYDYRGIVLPTLHMLSPLFISSLHCVCISGQSRLGLNLSLMVGLVENNLKEDMSH